MAAFSAPVAWRKARPAAITSATPTPVRDTATAVRAALAGSRAGLAARSGAAGDGRGRSDSSGVSAWPSDWRQISTPPVAISTSGQTMASENQSPSARKVSRALSRSSPLPRATSTAARTLDGVRSTEPASPAGTTSQASR